MPEALYALYHLVVQMALMVKSLPASAGVLGVQVLSCVSLFATPWTAVYQAPPSMGFSRQAYWSGLIEGEIPPKASSDKSKII